MSPRRSQSEDRRRRVLVDDSRNEASATRPRIFRGDSDGPMPRYNQAALQAINAPIARYIPLRQYTLLVWFLTGLVPIMGLLLLNSLLPDIRRVIGANASRAFDLNANGNLMQWLSSVTFGFAVAVMLGTYSVRRHRRDDYRGRFTVWRWGIIAAVLVSIDATTGLHHTWQAACQYITKTNLWGDGSIWWVGIWSLLLGAMMLRLMFEMSSSRAAVVWAGLAAACYAWAAIVELQIAPIGSEQTARTTQLTALLLGHHLTLFALVNYAREVVLEAMGLVESPAIRRARSQAAKSEQKAARLAKQQEKAEVREAKQSAKKQTAEQQTTKQQTVRKQTAKKASESPTAKTETSTALKPAAKRSAAKRPAAEPTNAAKKPGPLSLKLRAVSPNDDEDSIDTESTASPKHKQAAKPKLKFVRPDDDEDDFDDEPKLSKAERKRLRKEQKRQQRKAA